MVFAYGRSLALMLFVMAVVEAIDCGPGLKVKSDGQCVKMRRTGGCSPTGPREAQYDMSCDTPVLGANSGYCECSGGRKARESSCDNDRAPFTCAQACGGTEDTCVDCEQGTFKAGTNDAQSCTRYVPIRARCQRRRPAGAFLPRPSNPAASVPAR